MTFYVLFSSVTYAMKAKKAFNKYGYKVTMGRPKQNMSECGCSYALEINLSDKSKLYDLIKQSNVEYRNIYYEAARGKYVEVRI